MLIHSYFIVQCLKGKKDLKKNIVLKKGDFILNSPFFGLKMYLFQTKHSFCQGQLKLQLQLQLS